MASVAPRRPGFRRHLPMLAFALALAVLIIAAAKPQRTVAVPVERASIMLVTDVSGSMEATDVKPSRLVAARRAEESFVELEITLGDALAAHPRVSDHRSRRIAG